MCNKTMVSTLFPFTIILTIIDLIVSNANGFSVKMIPIESPTLQILPNHLSTNHEHRHQFLVNMSISRSFQFRKDNMAPGSIAAKLVSLPGNRIVTQIGIGIKGTGAYNTPILILDTGSDVTWLQCRGCNPCFDLPEANNFDYRNSDSFERIMYDDQVCRPLPQFYQRDGSCGFRLEYGIPGQQVAVQGLIGRETFHFQDPNTRYGNLLFGCLLESPGNVFGTPNNIAGLFGMSAGPKSFLSQLDPVTKGRFSYCLPRFTRNPLALSTLYFGDDAQISGDDIRQVQTIPMHAVDHGYHLDLYDISVEGVRLNVGGLPAFRLNERAGTGFYIDSGAPYTVLPLAAYEPLKRQVMAFFPMAPMTSGNPMDLCYKTPDGQTTSSLIYPRVVFHFGNYGNVNMVMRKTNMFEAVGSIQGFCMAVVPIRRGSCLFGAYQQANFQFLYDVPNSALSFVPKNCREN